MRDLERWDLGGNKSHNLYFSDNLLGRYANNDEQEDCGNPLYLAKEFRDILPLFLQAVGLLLLQ